MKLVYKDVLAAAQIGASEETLASLGRIYQHYLASGEKSFAILSPWRSSLPKKTNLENVAALKQTLRSAGLGFMEMKGKWKNDQGEVESEPSFFVPGIPLSVTQTILERFDQDAVVYSGPETKGDVFLYNLDGSTQDLGKFHPNRIGDVFSDIKGKQFTFAGVALGFLDAVLKDQPIDQAQVEKTRLRLKEFESNL